MRCLHCHGGEALQEDSHSLARDRCYYCQHSKYGNGRMECEKCQVKYQPLLSLPPYTLNTDTAREMELQH